MTIKTALNDEYQNHDNTSVQKNTIKIIIFFYSVLRPFQDNFCSYETGQSVGGAKTGEPREKPPGTPASRTWLVSHVASEGLEPTPDNAACHLGLFCLLRGI